MVTVMETFVTAKEAVRHDTECSSLLAIVMRDVENSVDGVISVRRCMW